jgi:hypothetical protein
MSKVWAICEGDGVGGYCLYEQASLRKMKESGGVFRCIKHGSILEFAGDKYNGMTRAQVRAAIKRETEK